MTDTAKVSFFKKGKVRPTTNRQRSPKLSSESATANTFATPDATSVSEAVIPTRKAPSRLLSQGTKRTRDPEDGEANSGVDVNWAAGSSSNVNAALGILEGDEAEALLERKRLKQDNNNNSNDEPYLDDGLYRGQSAYKNHITKNKEVPKAMRVGPQKSTSTIRTVTIIDYQPDVCKDYKETGFCGFGDTCKFLHDRGTYLAGWQLDKLAAEPQKNADEAAESDSDSDEDIPFACLICRKPYTDPVVTRCGHYFCSNCAIKRFAKTPKCLACGAPTGGIFNRADKIIAKRNATRERRKAQDDEDDTKQPSVGIEVEGLVEQSESDESDE